MEMTNAVAWVVVDKFDNWCATYIAHLSLAPTGTFSESTLKIERDREYDKAKAHAKHKNALSDLFGFVAAGAAPCRRALYAL